MKSIIFCLCLSLLFLFQGCQLTQNLNERKTSIAHLGSHKVTIIPASEKMSSSADASAGRETLRYSGGGLEVIIENEDLTVNGKRYGKLNKEDAITINYDKVFVNSKELRPIS